MFCLRVARACAAGSVGELAEAAAAAARERRDTEARARNIGAVCDARVGDRYRREPFRAWRVEAKATAGFREKSFAAAARRTRRRTRALFHAWRVSAVSVESDRRSNCAAAGRSPAAARRRSAAGMSWHGDPELGAQLASPLAAG